MDKQQKMERAGAARECLRESLYDLWALGGCDLMGIGMKGALGIRIGASSELPFVDGEVQVDADEPSSGAEAPSHASQPSWQLPPVVCALRS